jgi:hypothetical protein
LEKKESNFEKKRKKGKFGKKKDEIKNEKVKKK